MRYKRLKICIILLFGLKLTVLQAQEVIIATGGNALGDEGSMSYSVGQVVYTNIIGSNGTVAQGIQQPYEITVVTNIEEASGINLKVMAYPNPTNDYLTLEVEDFEYSSLKFHLYDLQGKLLESKKLESNQTNIIMSNLLPATYFLKVSDSMKEVKTFKIIKN